MGDGFALQPTGHDIVAPVSGVVIATQGHAFGIRRSDGLEVLTHVGLETVSLDGKPFEWRIKEGDQVNAGDHVGDVDLAEIKAAHLDTTTMVVFTNTADVLDKLTLISGQENVSAGETVADATVKTITPVTSSAPAKGTGSVGFGMVPILVHVAGSNVSIPPEPGSCQPIMRTERAPPARSGS